MIAANRLLFCMEVFIADSFLSYGMPNGAEGREDIQKILNPEKTECTNESAGVLDIFPAHWQMREVLTEKESINRHTLP